LAAAPFALILLLLLLVAALPVIVPPEQVKEAAIDALRQLLASDAAVEDLDYHPLDGVEIAGFRIGPPPGFRRDVLVAERLSVHYDVTSAIFGDLVIDEVRLVRPRLVLEERDGVLNVVQLFSDLDEGPPAPEEPGTLPDRTSPLLPMLIRARRVRIDDLELELVGGNHELVAKGISLHVDAEAGPERILAHVMARIAGELRLTRSAPELVLTSALDVTLTATAAADASKGLTIEHVAVGLNAEAGHTIVEGSGLEPVDLRVGVELDGSASQDRLQVNQVDASFGSTSLVAASASVQGLQALLTEAIGVAATSSVAAYIGLSGAGDGRMRADVQRRTLPLDELAPYVRAVLPGVTIGGRLGVGPIAIHASLPELLALAPRRMTAAVELDGVRVALPAGAAVIGPVHGEVTAETSSASVTSVAWRTDVGLLGFGPTRLAGARVALDATGASMDVDGHGTVQASLRVAAAGFEAPGLEVRGASTRVHVEGRDLFDPERPLDVPIAVEVAAEVAELEIATGTRSLSFREARAAVAGDVDRLVQPSRTDITTHVSVAAGRVVLPSVTIDGANVRGRLVTPDPRTDAAIDPSARLRLRASRVEVPHLVVDAVDATIAATAHGLVRLLDGTPDLERVSAKGTIAAAEVLLDHPSTGRTALPMNTALDASYRLSNGRLDVRSLVAEAGDVARVALDGRVVGLGRGPPTLAVRADVGPLNLAAATRSMPARWREALPGFAASGTVTTALTIDGKLPAFDEVPNLTALPGRASLHIRAAGVSMSAPRLGLDVTNLDNDLELVVSPDELALSSRTEFEAIDRPGVVFGRGVRARTQAGLRKGVWSIRGELDAVALSAATAEVGTASAARARVELVYPRGGTVDLRHLEVALPQDGLTAELSGRLTRSPSRAFVPKVKGRANVDLDRLRYLFPFIGSASGRLAGEIGIEPAGSSGVDFFAVTEVDGFSYASPTVLLLDANGRVPLRQRVALPPPTPDDGPRGAVERLMDDDLVPRLLELLGLFTGGARLVVDADDVLSDAPRTAAYESLRPYYTQDPRFSARELVIGGLRVGAMSVDALYSSGVIRLDRFAGQLWEGDVFGDLAVQLAGPDDIRARMRLTVTDLNIDIPTAPLLGIPRVDPDDRELYLVSGIADLRVKVSRRSINGNVDIDMGAETIVRLIDAIDPKGEDEQLQSIRSQLASILEGILPFVFGEELSGARIWVSQNLLNQTFVWDRPWFSYNPLVPIFRLIQVATGELSELLAGKRWEPTLVNLVPEIRRRNLAEVWELAVWAWIVDLFSPVAGAIEAGDVSAPLGGLTPRAASPTLDGPSP